MAISKRNIDERVDIRVQDSLEDVKDVLVDIKNGLDVSTKLHRLREDSDRLSAEAQQLAKRFEGVEAYYISQVETIQREIGDLGQREEELKKKKQSEMVNLEFKQSVLRQNKQELSSAEVELTRAKQKLEKAKEEERKNIRTGAIIGAAVLGIFGAGIGAGVGAIVNSFSNEVSEAEDKIKRRRSDCEEAKSEVEKIDGQISRIQSEINQNVTRTEKLRRKRLNFHTTAGKIKDAIVLIKRSTEFWELFKQTSEHGSNRTSLVEGIVNRCKERENLLNSGASKKIATTFLEAWEKIQEAAIEGNAFHFLHIEFTCAYCKDNFIALPCVDSKNQLVCVQCNHQNAIEK